MRPTTARAGNEGSGQAQQLSNNPGGLKKTGSSKALIVEAEGNDLVHSDGKTKQKAIELLRKYKDMEKPFFWQWDSYGHRSFGGSEKISNLTRLANGAAAKIPGIRTISPEFR